MKNKLTIFLLILLIPLAVGLEETILKTEIEVTYNSETKVLNIVGENLDWSKTVNESFDIDLEILLGRTLANLTEYTEKMELCVEQLNFSQKWEDCIKLNTELDIERRQMINGTAYEGCLKNVTDTEHKCELDLITVRSSKDKEVSAATKEKDEIEKKTSWWKILTVAGWGIAIYFGFKYKAWGRTETPQDRDKPVDRQY